MQTALAWIAVSLYAAVLVGLAVRGARKTGSVESFSVGDGGTPAVLVGLALTAQLTSVATFVINPGFVFHYGVSALLGLGGAAASGITLGLIVFSARFRQVGTQVAALTLPQWIGERYGSKVLRGFFALLSLGLVAFAVLIVVALAYVLGNLLGLAPPLVAVGLTAFVAGYVLFGGANTHAWTNSVQAVVMLVVALILIGRGVPLLLDGSFLSGLAAEQPQLLAATNPGSPYFRDLFEVFVCNFLVGLALVCQPHIVSKSLYLRDDAQVTTMLQVAVVAGLVFLGVMVTGLYARAVVPPETRLDLVIPTWIGLAFPGPVQVLIGLGMLSAGLSTLEGILLALASIFSIDVWSLGTGRKPDASALRFGRVALVALAALIVVLARYQIANPTSGSVAIFAQYGVYLLFTGAFLPLACGMFIPAVSTRLVTAASVASVGTFLAVGLFELGFWANNPAFLATAGLAAGWVVVGGGLLAARSRATSPPPVATSAA